MRLVSSVKWSVSLVVIGLLAGLYAGEALAQAPATQKTATEFYMEYQAAFVKAKRVEELLPFLTAARRKEVESTPAGERTKILELIKMLNPTGIKVLKEERTATGATLTAEGIDQMDKQKATGKIEVVREGGAWKLGAESWSN